MNPRKWATSSDVAEVVRVCLEEGLPVEIDGIGVFRNAEDGGFVFIPETRPRIFLAYAAEDQHTVERLYDDLESLGFDPWMDRRKLLPGQNWPDSIRRTIEVSDYFLACFSESSVRKRGHFQAELRLALETRCISFPSGSSTAACRWKLPGAISTSICFQTGKPA